MTKTTFTVYWMYRTTGPAAIQYTDMNEALAWTAHLRKRAFIDGISAITMCSENANIVGKMGVDSIVDGKTPDGVEYDWNKSSRIGKLKHSERDILISKKDEK